MRGKKTVTMNLRVVPAIRDVAKLAADREHRSVANLVEVLIRERCRKLGITIPEQAPLFKEQD